MLKKIFVHGLLLSFLTIMLPLQSIAMQENCKRGVINASYTVEKQVEPDTVEISIEVESSSKSSITDASKDNNVVTDKIYKYLKSNIDINEKDFIKTSNYSARPIYTYNSNNKRVLDRYVVSNTVIVHTKSIDKLPVIIENVMALGATDISGLNFSLSNKDFYCNEMIKTAVVNAKTKAEVIANAAGVNLDSVKSIDTSYSVNQERNFSYSRKLYATNGLDVAAAPSPSLAPGVIKLYSTANVSYFVK